MKTVPREQEVDLIPEKKWFHEKYAKTACENLKRNHINAEYVSDRKEALAKALSMIPEGATIGWGDSVTLHQVGIISYLLKEQKHDIFDHWERTADGTALRYQVGGDERLQLMRKALTADVYITGTNALTLDGKLVNIDSTGNRVAAMIFGPKKVIIIAGVNKIVKNLDEAIRRCREVCAPINAERHIVKHGVEAFAELPCVKTGACHDCKHAYRICLNTVIIEGEMPASRLTRASLGSGDPPARLNVIIVGEELGI